MASRLRGLLDPATAAAWHARLAALPGGSRRLATLLDLADVLQALAPLRRALVARLGEAPQVLVDQCWLRHAQPPHGWHQDGALHHDFLARPPGAPLPMWTVWIALTPCGDDAPGLEWVATRLPQLLAPAALTPAAVQARFDRAAFACPRLDAGDALLFDGALLHRTQQLAAPARTRSSLELRFIGAGPPPPALAGEARRAWTA